jgi:hypothetical protein
VREHPKHHIRIQWGDNTWKMSVNHLKVGSADLWGRPIPGWLRLHRLSSGWLLGGSQGRFPMYGSVRGGLLGFGPLYPCAEHVAASDSSGSSSLGLMRCHGHMASCVPACRHVAWCPVHISLIRAPMYANDISVLIVSTSPSQWCRPIWNLRLFMKMSYLCHWFIYSQLYHSMHILMCPATKDGNTNTCGNSKYKALLYCWWSLLIYIMQELTA